MPIDKGNQVILANLVIPVNGDSGEFGDSGESGDSANSGESRFKFS